MNYIRVTCWNVVIKGSLWRINHQIGNILIAMYKHLICNEIRRIVHLIYTISKLVKEWKIGICKGINAHQAKHIIFSSFSITNIIFPMWFLWFFLSGVCVFNAKIYLCQAPNDILLLLGISNKKERTLWVLSIFRKCFFEYIVWIEGKIPSSYRLIGQ